MVGLGVGPPCLRLDAEETLPVLLDERGEMSCTVPGVTLDGGPVEGCNRLRCPLARMSGLQCLNMGHNGHGINLYGVSMTRMGN